MSRMKILLLFGLLLTCTNTLSVFAQEEEARVDSVNVRVVLVDGSSYVGILIADTDTELSLETTAGVLMTIPRERIKSVDSLVGKRFFRLDPNLTRLLFAPTARPVKSGHGYLAIYELFFPFVAIGVGNIATLAGGISLLPGSSEQLLYVAPKVTIVHTTGLSFAAGGIVGTVTRHEGNAGLVFGLGTFGKPEASVTVGVAYGFVEGDFLTQPVLLLAGDYQISNSVKLISENYIFPGLEDGIVVTGGIRFFGDRLAADLALITAPTVLDEMEGWPFLPWLGFAYNFGN